LLPQLNFDLPISESTYGQLMLNLSWDASQYATNMTKLYLYIYICPIHFICVFLPKNFFIFMKKENGKFFLFKKISVNSNNFLLKPVTVLHHVARSGPSFLVFVPARVPALGSSSGQEGPYSG